MPPERSCLVCEDGHHSVQFSAALDIGRHSLNGLTIDRAEVSVRHAQILWREGGWSVRDLGSSNGTTVNQRRLRGWRALREGDLLCFAGCSSWRVARLCPPSDEETRAYQQTRELSHPPDERLVLVLSPAGAGEGMIQLATRGEGGDSKASLLLLGQLRTGQGYFLLAQLAKEPGQWFDDGTLRQVLWGRMAARMARSNLHTLIGNLRKRFTAWGVTASLLEKRRGQTRLALTEDQVMQRSEALCLDPPGGA